jgi:hypothetical protein
MNRSLLSALTLFAGSALFLLASASGCGDSLVGLSCRTGYTQCGQACFDLQSDPMHCGSCDNRCASDELCSAGECTFDPDAGADAGPDAGDDGGGDMDGGDAGDAGRNDAGDGGDAGSEGGSANEGGWADVELPPLCMGASSPAECVCGLGELICDRTCVNAGTDDKNCGACGMDCNAVPPPSGRYFCVGGACQLNCDPPLSVCGSLCIDLQIDPNNCGSCGNLCASGLCDQGLCLDATAGHVIVIGHDMSSALPAAKRLAGNAIFLPAKQKVEGLIYDERSTLAARNGVQTVISEMTAATGRMFDSTTASSALSVPFLLSQVDVFVIVAQANASDEVLQKNADTWSRALQTFVARGGVVVLFDGGGTNTGTYQLLQGAGLFTANSRMSLSPRTVNIVAPGDAIASFVSTRYMAQNQTVGFDSPEATVVVRDLMSGLPVVIHIAR